MQEDPRLSLEETNIKREVRGGGETYEGGKTGRSEVGEPGKFHAGDLREESFKNVEAGGRQCEKSQEDQVKHRQKRNIGCGNMELHLT